MVADGQKVDLNLSASEISLLSPEERAEYEKQLAMTRAEDVQAGIEAYMMGNEKKLAELRDKFNKGRERSGKLFEYLDGARDKYMTQSTNVWNANRAFYNARDNYTIWNNANQGYQAFKSGESTDLTTFSGGTLGSPLTDIHDSSRIATQGRFIIHNTDKMQENMLAQQQKLDNEHESLKQNKKDKDVADRALDDQLWRNKMTVDEMEYYTYLQTMNASIKNWQA